MKNKFIVFVFAYQRSSSSTRFDGFGRRLKKAANFPEEVDVVTVALENLVYVIDENGEAHVYDAITDIDLNDALYVYMKSWEAMPEEAAALGIYLYHKGIQFADHAVLGMGVSKLVTGFRLWSDGLRVPFTMYVRRSELLPQAVEKWQGKLGRKFIVKDIVGAKGKLNFLVDKTQAIERIDEHKDAHFIIQRYIENDGDYRVGIYFERVGFVIKRVGDGSSHLNNISAGGSAEYIDTTEADRSLKHLAKKAARSVNLQVCGVDLIQEKQSKKLYVLEVNQGSQIVTGAYSEENIASFNHSLRSELKERNKRNRKKAMKIIGRRAIVKLTELGVESAVAKIDTGAYSSTLHAENIRIVTENGVDVLKFEVMPSSKLKTYNNTKHSCEFKEFFMTQVSSSNGHSEMRYAIQTKIALDGVRFPAVLTLSDRSKMSHSLLIGRRLLRSRFLVNVELNEDNEFEWKN
ncbi:MAG: RimK/LysX family protein [Candidatus Saccharimonadales bacterium]